MVRPAKTSRFLPHEHWAHMRATIEALPTDTPRLARQVARYRWIFSLLCIGGLRISEVCHNSMGDFYWRRSADGRERWWLEIRGKGEKTRVIPATAELVALHYPSLNGAVHVQEYGLRACGFSAYAGWVHRPYLLV